MQGTAQSFHRPAKISQEKQVGYCVQIIEKQRAEVTPLRQQVSQCHQYHNALIEQTKEWREKYHKEKKEKEQWRESYEKAQ